MRVRGCQSCRRVRVRRGEDGVRVCACGVPVGEFAIMGVETGIPVHASTSSVVEGPLFSDSCSSRRSPKSEIFTFPHREARMLCGFWVFRRDKGVINRYVRDKEYIPVCKRQGVIYRYVRDKE